MPELPDLTLYLEALHGRVLGHHLLHVRVDSPFVLRSVEPPLERSYGKQVVALRLVGKRIVIRLEGEHFLVIHLMVAGRLHWRASSRSVKRRSMLAAFEFDSGILELTETGTKRRASLHLIQGETALSEFDRGGVDVLSCSRDIFAARLRSENHTLKRALADPRLFSGIGNAYSDEILHEARLSPMTLTSGLSDNQLSALFHATRSTLGKWTERLRDEAGGEFPAKVTAFREGMAVHGRYGKPCPDCGAPVQRIRYAENETNYCARCQNGGRLLADRALSRLLRQDWPRSLEEMEEIRSR